MQIAKLDLTRTPVVITVSLLHRNTVWEFSSSSKFTLPFQLTVTFVQRNGALGDRINVGDKILAVNDCSVTDRNTFDRIQQKHHITRQEKISYQFDIFSCNLNLFIGLIEDRMRIIVINL